MKNENSFRYRSTLLTFLSLILISVAACGGKVTDGDPKTVPESTPYEEPTPPPSPTPTPLVKRPKHGENISPRGKGSNEHKLTIRNNSGYDAIAKLTDHSTGKIYRHVYIYQGKTLTLGGIRNGTFELKFALGEDYSPETGTFLTASSFTKFDSLFDFAVEYFPGGYYTDAHEVTLAKVVGGNASTSAISASDF